MEELAFLAAKDKLRLDTKQFDEDICKDIVEKSFKLINSMETSVDTVYHFYEMKCFTESALFKDFSKKLSKLKISLNCSSIGMYNPYKNTIVYYPDQKRLDINIYYLNRN